MVRMYRYSLFTAAQFLRRLFYLPFLNYGKGGSCAAKDSKAVVQCHKEKPDGAPYGRRQIFQVLPHFSYPIENPDFL